MISEQYILTPFTTLFETTSEQLAEVFKFTVNSGTDSKFILPTSAIGGSNTTYSWNVDWGDNTSSIETGTGSFDNDTGIEHAYPAANTNYQITLSPVVDEYGWSKCFGFSQNESLAGVQTNRDKVISVDTPFTFKMVCADENGNAVNQFGTNMFEKCTNLSDISNCYIPEGVIHAKEMFCARMFTECSSLTTLGNFTLPQSIFTANGGFCTCMFMDCTALADLGSFNLPQNLSGNVGYMFLYAMFERDTALTSLGNFQIPQGITTVGDQTFYGMFADCTALSNIGSLSIPASISSVGTEFCAGMFLRTSSLTTLPETFKLPTNITTITGDSFLSQMFQGSAITTLPSSFVVNTTVTSVQNNFMYQMFAASKLTTVPNTFMLPTSITSAGDNCFRGMFGECTQLTSLGNVNVPQSITTVGTYFFAYFCRDNPLITTLPSTLKLPASLSTIGTNFCQMAFHGCTSLVSGAINFMSSLNLNQTQINKTYVFNGTFANCPSLNETYNTTTIPQLNITPSTSNLCFYNVPATCTTNCPYYWYTNVMTARCLDKNAAYVDFFVLNTPVEVGENILMENNGVLVYANDNGGRIAVTQTNRDGNANKYWLGSNNALTYPMQYVPEYTLQCISNGTIISRTENPWKGFTYHANNTGFNNCHVYYISYNYNFIAGKQYKIELCNIVENSQSYGTYNVALQNTHEITLNLGQNIVNFVFQENAQYIVQNSSISVSPNEYEPTYTITVNNAASYLVLAASSSNNSIQGFNGSKIRITQLN